MNIIPSKNADDFKLENQKGIHNHHRIAEHLQTAAKYHLEACKQLEAGSHSKAAQSVIIAQGFVRLATEGQYNDAVHHTTYN